MISAYVHYNKKNDWQLWKSCKQYANHKYKVPMYCRITWPKKYKTRRIDNDLDTVTTILCFDGS